MHSGPPHTREEVEALQRLVVAQDALVEAFRVLPAESQEARRTLTDVREALALVSRAIHRMRGGGHE